MLELVPDAHERPPRVERLAQHLEQRRPLLEHLEQVAVALDLVALRVDEQAGRTADVQALLLLDRRR